MRATAISLFASQLIALAVIQASEGATFYVAPSGSDSADGTKERPWRTLQRAANAVRAGDTVLVRPGNYAGFVLGWDHPESGTMSRPITFKADSGAVIERRNSKTPDGINLEACSYVTIDGFSVTNTLRTITRAGIRSGGRSQGVIIRNNNVDGCGTWGIFTSFADDSLIEGNTTAHSAKEHGIYVSNSATHPVIRGNRTFGNRVCGIQCNGDLVQGSTGLIKAALIEGNIAYENGRHGGSAINLDGVQDSLIQNNLLYENHANGISLYRIDGAAGSKHNRIINNTVVQAKDSRWCVNIKGGSTDNAVFNNILYHLGPRGAVNLSSDSLDGFMSDYNAVVNRFSPDDGETFIRLDRWQRTTGQDQHSLVVTLDALFADSGQQNYRLKAGSPAIGTGARQFAPASDLDGTPRPQDEGVDLGAFRFAPNSPLPK
jgi:parallel beta-helix repeat protein